MNGRRYRIRVKQSRSEELGIWECWQEARPARHKEPGDAFMHSAHLAVATAMLLGLGGRLAFMPPLDLSVYDLMFKTRVSTFGPAKSRTPAKTPDQTISGSALYKTQPMDTYRYCVHLDHNATPRGIAPPHQALPHPQMPRSTWILRALSHAHSTVPRISINPHFTPLNKGSLDLQETRTPQTTMHMHCVTHLLCYSPESKAGLSYLASVA
jgi:hypothetical protein